MTIAPETNHPAVQAARAARARLDRREAEIAQLLINRYVRLTNELRPLVRDLIAEYEIALAAGEELTKGQITRLRRYSRLQEQMLVELQAYGEFTANVIDTASLEAIQASANDALAITQANFRTPSARAAVATVWNRLPVEAIENAIGVTDVLGQRYRTLYAPHYADRFMDEIMDAMIRGQNPRITARRGAKLLKDRALTLEGEPLTDALRQSRTAQIWSWREATRANYVANSDIISGWTWGATMDDRTCMSCLANHGKTFPLSQTLNDHHNGRCVMLPNVAGADSLGLRPIPLESGEDIFNALPREQQIKRMGKGKLEAYRDGKFKFDDLTTDYDDPVYGTMRREATLKQLVGAP